MAMMRKRKKKRVRNRRARFMKMPTPAERTWMRRLFSLLSLSVTGENKGAQQRITLELEEGLDLAHYEANMFGYYDCPAARCMERCFEKKALESHIRTEHSRASFRCVRHQQVLRGTDAFNTHFRTMHAKRDCETATHRGREGCNSTDGGKAPNLPE